jgi:hypothetical protein
MVAYLQATAEAFLTSLLAAALGIFYDASVSVGWEGVLVLACPQRENNSGKVSGGKILAGEISGNAAVLLAAGPGRRFGAAARCRRSR